MQPGVLPTTSFPEWAQHYGVEMSTLKLAWSPSVDGFGLVTQSAVTSSQSSSPVLLTVPPNLILSAPTIDAIAEVDEQLRELLHVMQAMTAREKIMLFLLLHTTRPAPSDRTGLSAAWTEYAAMLPRDVPVPTMWPAAEQCQLVGTSLAEPLKAKLTALRAEFTRLTAQARRLSWWHQDDYSFRDWLCLDAWYRSRCLDLPASGPSLVPGLDLVNHATPAVAYFEQLNSTTPACLHLRPGATLAAGAEISIDYGATKGAAEMLHSYGPWLAFICLNEEDGLTLRRTATGSQLEVYWKGHDVKAATANFTTLTAQDPQQPVFALRVLAMVQTALAKALQELELTEPFWTPTASRPQQLRQIEHSLVADLSDTVEEEIACLLATECVQQYLANASGLDTGLTDIS
ncbi:hypothetical protein BGT96224_A20587 [Blumeria graminis f. sp. tritici 96224]|uniref:SET domain-containing protein n=1 Tax=Blumeria graminis f. sp. tritici 96224 TaxID=1268274 RepID=A0A656KHN4_BLUGR|nr:hypothetical protein BGT96224_A20587 [Blumeria graminis f. sp. tritici 96224]